MIPREYKSIYPELIFNQYKSKLCVACSISLIRHIQLFYKHGINVIPDPLFIFCIGDNDLYQEKGMIVSKTLSDIKQYGIPEINDNPNDYLKKYSDYQYNDLKHIVCSNKNILDRDKIKDYCQLYTVNDIKEAIMKYHAITITIKSHESIIKPDITENKAVINYYKYDTYPTDNYHQLTIIGWDNNYWIIQNSMGKEYGKNGIAYLPIDFPLYESWCIIDD